MRLKGKGIQLDSYDFSCLIQYFTNKELKGLFKEYGIKKLEFIDFENCFSIVENIFSYFESKKNQFNNRYLYQKISEYIKNVVEILKYASLTIEQYKYVVNNIFKIDNHTLNIGNKILFLDKQQALNPNIEGSEICRILEYVFEGYINELINSINHKTNFNEDSVNSLYHIDIINYIVANDNEFKSDTITKQIERMIESQNYIEIETLINIIPILHQGTVDKILTIIKEEIEINFNFSIIESMISNNLERECQKFEDKLVKYIKGNLTNIQKLKLNYEEINGEIDFNRLSELSKLESHINHVLESIGYWSLIGILNKEKYNEFKNINKMFDFFIDMDSFDFDRFDESWLLKFSISAHKNISKNEKVKKYIKKKIEGYLNDSSFDLQQKESLLKLYFEIYNS